MRPVATYGAVLLLTVLSACSRSSQSNGGAASSPTPALTADVPQTQAPPIDPCSKFTSADAQSIMGVPMKAAPSHGANVCMYEEASPKSAADTARISLMLNVRSSANEEDRAWHNIKVIRRLSAGEKNITQLSGIGDEAWFDGNTQNGKLGMGGIIARKGKTDFMLESAVLTYRASEGQMKNIAKKIAGQLP